MATDHVFWEFANVDKGGGSSCDIASSCATLQCGLKPHSIIMGMNVFVSVDT